MTIFKYILGFCLFFSSALHAAPGNLYRYTDKNGELVMSSTLPGEAADRGYEVLSPRGNVIEVVKPRMTQGEISQMEADKALQEQKKQKEALAAQAREKQARKDALLLKMFSSEQDISRSRDDKVHSIETQMAITIENLVRLEEQLKTAFETKKALQLQNSVIPKMLIDTITDTKTQIEDNVDFLKRKELEKEQIKSQYQEMLDRFRKVKGIPQKAIVE